MQSLSRLVGIGYLLVCLAAVGASFAIGPVGYAPFPLTAGPPQEPVVVTVWYGTEKKAWLENATARFLATQPKVGTRPVQVVLHGLGSREMAERVAHKDWRNDGQPTVISPASSLWVETLTTDWAANNPGAAPVVASGADAPRPLVLTPMVLVAWEARARALWPAAPDAKTFWSSLHDALADQRGWKGVIERRKGEISPQELAQLQQAAESWGFVKFGHTSPMSSNSGAQTLLLLAYGYHNKSSGLSTADVADPAFQSWLLDVESSVPEFPESTGTLMDNMVQFGPSKYDMIATYENLAIANIETAKGRWGAVRVYYPPATSLSDHPYAILSGDWVSQPQREAAAQFRSFLLSRPIQELALSGYGFRPADPGVPVVSGDINNPFNRYKSYGLQTDIAQQVATPDGTTIGAMLAFWQQRVNR